MEEIKDEQTLEQTPEEKIPEEIVKEIPPIKVKAKGGRPKTKVEVSYECNECNLVFKAKKSLDAHNINTHIKQHLNELPHKNEENNKKLTKMQEELAELRELVNKRGEHHEPEKLIGGIGGFSKNEFMFTRR